jgi:hypothetical protein
MLVESQYNATVVALSESRLISEWDRQYSRTAENGITKSEVCGYHAGSVIILSCHKTGVMRLATTEYLDTTYYLGMGMHLCGTVLLSDIF